ncbi:MAG: hypothetical protein M3P34_06825 [Actinomycetota bacterium]|nr:hypothetical protein [Actinomycetota bacterium]
MRLSRRAFLQRAGVMAAQFLAPPDILRVQDRAWALTAATTAAAAGTTLESTLLPSGTATAS